MYKFSGFTEKANRALNSAIETAENMGHTYVGSEHLLAGVLKEDGFSSSAVLSKKRVTPQRVEEMIKRTVGVGIPTVLSPEDFSPRVQRILEVSKLAAKEENMDFISCQQILIALSKEINCSGNCILTQLGVAQSEILGELSGDKGRNGFSVKSPKKQMPRPQTPTLNQFGHDLTDLAWDGKIDPVIGREKEIERVIQILSRRKKNNPCLIGEPGVGKTAIAEGLALKIADGEVPDTLKDKRLVSVDLTGMVAGTKYRGDFEERIRTALNEVTKAGNIILFIDEIHTLIGAGSAEGAVDAANILKPHLTRSEIQVIGATTIEEYRRHIEKDAALERRFQRVNVCEPTENEAVDIIKGVRDKYESHHNVKITDSAIASAVKMSVRYITDRFLPDKAIDLIDEACSRMRIKAFTPPQSIKALEGEIKKLNDEKRMSVNNQDFEKAARLRDKEKQVLQRLNEKRTQWKEKSQRGGEKITEKEICEIVSLQTGIPVEELTKEEKERLKGLEEELNRDVIGQKSAVKAVADAVRRGRSGINDPNRPLGTFIFLGSTGVGKTELCKALSKALFGDVNSVIKLDMSEYMDKHSSSKLIGSPPGYVGFEKGGQLTERVRRKPYSVVVFDEIEKAHPDIYNMLLQVLDEGELTDSQGVRVNFKNTIVILTSNLGAKIIAGSSCIAGFSLTQDEDNSDTRINQEVYSELKKTFRPEFLNRIDEVIIFNKLKMNDVMKITEKMLSEVRQRLEENEYYVSFDESAVKLISKKGMDEMYGARPVKREITTQISNVIADKIMSGDIKKKKEYFCYCKNERIIVSER